MKSTIEIDTTERFNFYRWLFSTKLSFRFVGQDAHSYHIFDLTWFGLTGEVVLFKVSK